MILCNDFKLGVDTCFTRLWAKANGDRRAGLRGPTITVLIFESWCARLNASTRKKFSLRWRFLTGSFSLWRDLAYYDNMILHAFQFPHTKIFSCLISYEAYKWCRILQFPWQIWLQILMDTTRVLRGSEWVSFQSVHHLAYPIKNSCHA